MTNEIFRLNDEFAVRLHKRCVLATEGVLNSASVDQKEDVRVYAPSHKHIQTLVEISFWASLKKEEGRYHNFSLIFSPADQEFDIDPFFFDSQLPFTSEQLAKIAPALQSTANSIGVWPNERDELIIWGFTQLGGGMSPSIRTFEPGQLIVSFDYGVEAFTALITGSRAEFIDPGLFTIGKTLAGRITPSYLENLEEFKTTFSRYSALKTIANFMRAHGHGGTLLVVPNDENWIKSIHQPMLFAGRPYEKVKTDLKRKDEAFEQEMTAKRWLFTSETYNRIKDTAQRSLGLIGQFTAIDGATIVDYDLSVFAFGVKIKPMDAEKRPNRVLTSEPFEESKEEEIEISELGGTRHQSAAQFVFDQREAMAIVSSQDGRVSVLAWEPEKQMVSVTRHVEFAFL